MDTITKQPEFFTNLNKVPLNELNIQYTTLKKIKKLPLDKDIEKIKDTLQSLYDQRLEKIPAIDPLWIQKSRSFYKYQPYFSEVSAEENLCFLTKNVLFLESIQFLLQCSYQQFWCYLVHDNRVLLMLDSFVLNAVVWYELRYLQGEYLSLYQNIYEQVSRVYGRMVTLKESDKEYMSQATITKLIDKAELLTYPKIYQICLLYRKNNPKLVERIVGMFFTENLSAIYGKEVYKMLDHVFAIFEMIGNQLCDFGTKSSTVAFGIKPRPKIFDPYWFEEVVTYLLDVASSLHAFLASCPQATELALKAGLPNRLTYFYNLVYPAIYRALEIKREMPCDWQALHKRILDHMAIGRSEFVNTFHVCTEFYRDNIKNFQDSPEKQESNFEDYLQLLTTAMEDEFFMFDYHNSHRIDTQIQEIVEFYKDIDVMRTNYVMECLNTLPELSEVLDRFISNQKETLPKKSPTLTKENIPPKEEEFIIPDENTIEEHIRTVLDTLPHLGDGFVYECLTIYNFNPFEVISAILDNNLSPALEDVQQDLIRVPPEPEPAQPILAYRGKKPTYRDTKDLLNDKRDLKDIKEFVLKSSTVAYDIYDDEYDDRYDDEPRAANRPNTEEPNPYQYMENRFENDNVVSDPSSSDSEEESRFTNPRGSNSKPSSTTAANPRNPTTSSRYGNSGGKDRSKPDFCENPEVIRERWAAAHGGRGGGGGGGGGGRDVVGRAKGQGQDKSVLHNRDKKNTNKSARANHNRKSGAQFKRNKGMMPG